MPPNTLWRVMRHDDPDVEQQIKASLILEHFKATFLTLRYNTSAKGHAKEHYDLTISMNGIRSELCSIKLDQNFFNKNETCHLQMSTIILLNKPSDMHQSQIYWSVSSLLLFYCQHDASKTIACLMQAAELMPSTITSPSFMQGQQATWG